MRTLTLGNNYTSKYHSIHSLWVKPTNILWHSHCAYKLSTTFFLELKKILVCHENTNKILQIILKSQYINHLLGALHLLNKFQYLLFTHIFFINIYSIIIRVNKLTLTRLRGRFPLNHVMNAAGRDPADSHNTSYLLSAMRGDTVFKILAVRGFTESNWELLNTFLQSYLDNTKMIFKFV